MLAISVNARRCHPASATSRPGQRRRIRSSSTKDSRGHDGRKFLSRRNLVFHGGCGCLQGCRSLIPQPADAAGSAAQVLGARNEWEDKWLSFVLSTESMGLYESKVRSLKQELFQEIGDAEEVMIVEGGIGAGANLPFFPRNGKAQVIGFEPNPELGKECAQRASAMQIPLHLEESPLGEGLISRQFHAVADFGVCTLVLCTVRNPLQAAEELISCVKPGGRIIFVEHVVAPPDTALRFQQSLFDPLQQAILGGCHLRRNTAAVFQNFQDKGLLKELWIREEMIPGAGLISPHIYGFATVA